LKIIKTASENKAGGEFGTRNTLC